ncbi:hypothetical protein, partial [Pseudomonas syringae group genomosp. 7]|uniref:hypothetical protein n=1 Tax=Pseudomonas syringae group genomosp. 7 TaxID=251699 RepID=UPI0037700259
LCVLLGVVWFWVVVFFGLVVFLVLLLWFCLGGGWGGFWFVVCVCGGWGWVVVCGFVWVRGVGWWVGWVGVGGLRVVVWGWVVGVALVLVVCGGGVVGGVDVVIWGCFVVVCVVEVGAGGVVGVGGWVWCVGWVLWVGVFGVWGSVVRWLLVGGIVV